MKDGKWKIENAERESTGERERLSAADKPFFVEKNCSACGAEARRGNAKFCLVCGKLLREDYQPLDTIRASYRLQGKSFDFRAAEARPQQEVADLFEQSKNSVAEIAWACLVYSLVPFLGILFVPLAVVVGGCGYWAASRNPHLGGRKLALTSVGLSLVVLAIQVFLWWLLYLIPELGRAH